MSWRPAARNPVERDVRIETHGDQLRVELYRGGRLQAARTFSKHGVLESVALAERWLVLGPAIFTLERVHLEAAA